MSFLDDIFGPLLTVGGVVAAPFTGGASLALTGAGASLMASGAAQKSAQQASQQQIQSQQQAMQIAQQQYAHAQQLYQPFTSGQAFQGLGNRVTAQNPMTLGNLAQFAQPQQSPMGAGPQVGTARTFPNGSRAVWDGKGWLKQ